MHMETKKKTRGYKFNCKGAHSKFAVVELKELKVI